MILISAQRSTAQNDGIIIPEQDAPLIFLDFTGHYVTATSWNWNGPIKAQPFTGNELLMQEIHNRIREDFSIFNINITRDSMEYEANHPYRRIRVIITPTHQWYGHAGGVAFIGSFNWGDETPVWIFSSLLQNNPKFIAEAASHEIGHALGLNHQSKYRTDCSVIEEYSSGKGSGQVGWAPIMGIGYYHNLTTWHIGTSSLGCTDIQDDIAVMQRNNDLRLKADDHSDDTSGATFMYTNATEFGLSGIINSSTDKDHFRIKLAGTTRINLEAIPFYAGPFNSGANVHLNLKILNFENNISSLHKAPDKLNAVVDTVLSAGTYFIQVEGSGNENMDRFNGLGTYMLTGTMAHALPVTRLSLQGKVIGNRHLLQWSFQADERIREIIVQYSTDGLNFKTLQKLHSAMRSHSWSPVDLPVVYYRVKIVSENSANSIYSGILMLQHKFEEPILINQDYNTKQVHITVSNPGIYNLYRSNGSIIRSGNLTKGTNRLSLPFNIKELFVLKVQTRDHQIVRKLHP